jgi:hypothetical protein
VLALVRRGVVAVGVDVTPAAVRHARARGAAVLLGSVFAPVPGAGHWRTVLLLDGNIGIGACPAQLLRRVAALLAPEGEVLVELTPPGRGVTIQRLRLEHRHAFSAWFEWATVAVDAIGEPAAEAQLVVAESWCDGGRWFARLVRR